MDQKSPEQDFHLSRLGWIWLAVLVLCFAASWIIGLSNDSTELTPRHDDHLELGLYAACFVAIVSAALVFFQSKGPLYNRLVMSLIVTPILALLGVFLLVGETSAVVEARRDFPPGQTKTFGGLVVIQRAYQTRGKGRSWNIQTTPLWSNIHITEQDYTFMLNHRSPHDLSNDPDEITSDGYFCARVTLQKAGDALRVMNAGNYKLPLGSVGVCSQLRAMNPRL